MCYGSCKLLVTSLIRFDMLVILMGLKTVCKCIVANN